MPRLPSNELSILPLVALVGPNCSPRLGPQDSINCPAIIARPGESVLQVGYSRSTAVAVPVTGLAVIVSIVTGAIPSIAIAVGVPVAVAVIVRVAVKTDSVKERAMMTKIVMTTAKVLTAKAPTNKGSTAKVPTTKVSTAKVSTTAAMIASTSRHHCQTKPQRDSHNHPGCAVAPNCGWGS